MLANRSGVCRKHLTALRYHLHHLLQGLKVPVGHRLLHQRPHPSAGCSSGEQGGRYSRSTPPAPPPAGRRATPPDPAPPSASPCCPSQSANRLRLAPPSGSTKLQTWNHWYRRATRNSGFSPNRCASRAKARTALASSTLWQRFLYRPPAPPGPLPAGAPSNGSLRCASGGRSG